MADEGFGDALDADGARGADFDAVIDGTQVAHQVGRTEHSSHEQALVSMVADGTAFIIVG